MATSTIGKGKFRQESYDTDYTIRVLPVKAIVPTDFSTRFRDHPAPTGGPALQLLFDGPPEIPADGLQAALREYHTDLATATAELGEAPAGSGAAYAGLLKWGEHAVKLLAYASAMPGDAVDYCLRHALLPEDVKIEAAQHRGHVLLYYAGGTADAFEAAVAVAAVAGVLARFGAFVTLHEAARTGILSHALLPDDDDEDMLETLRNLPLPYLYAGFAKMEVTDEAGVWMRTYAAHALGLPDLARRVRGHDYGRATFGLFTGIFGYLRETGLTLIPGEVVRVGEQTHLLPREPKASEWWLDSPGRVLVLDDAEAVAER
jgi:hypothetical protein